jgi:hypothetical protein
MAVLAQDQDQSNRKPKKSQYARASRRQTNTAKARELAVYDGQALVGTVKVAGDGTSVAFDPRGKRIGSFPSFNAASDALSRGAGPAAQQS